MTESIDVKKTQIMMMLIKRLRRQRRTLTVIKIMLLTRWLSLGNVCKRILLRASSLLLVLQCSIARNAVERRW